MKGVSRHRSGAVLKRSKTLFFACQSNKRRQRWRITSDGSVLQVPAGKQELPTDLQFAYNDLRYSARSEIWASVKPRDRLVL